MKKHIIFTLVFILVNVGWTQAQYKYKDIFEYIGDESYDQNQVMFLVRQSIKYDSTVANTYFQLGKTYENQIFSFDYLKSPKAIYSVIDSSVSYYDKFVLHLTEKEVKRRDEYYMEFMQSKWSVPDNEKKPTFSLITSDIRARRDWMLGVRDSLVQLTHLFNKSVEHYNKANDQFRAICEAHETLKEMYLVADDAFMDELSALKSSYDSSIYYFKEYSAYRSSFHFITKCPKYYSQKLRVEPIVNYRLHGLSKSYFLADVVVLWDYNAWQEGIKDFVNTEIKDFRNTITKADENLDEIVAQYETAIVPNESRYELAQRPILKIKKYDPTSFVVDLFTYKVSKANLLNDLILPIDTTKQNIDRSLRRLSRIKSGAENCFKTLNSVEFHLTENSKVKHQAFLNARYDGQLEKTIAAEKKYVTNKVRFAEAKLKELTILDAERITKDTSFVFENKLEVPLYVNATTGYFEEGELAVTNISTNSKGIRYLTGYKMQKGKKHLFVASANDSAVLWVTYPKIQFSDYEYFVEKDLTKSYSLGTAIQANNIGCVVAVRLGEQNPIEGVNLIMKISNSGNVSSVISLTSDLYIHNIFYDFEEGAFLTLSKGTKAGMSVLLEDVLISKVSEKGFELWEQRFQLKGMINSIVSSSSQYVFLINFNELVTPSGQQVKAESGDTPNKLGVYVLGLSRAGEFNGEKVINRKDPLFGTKLLVNEESKFNVLGFKGSYSLKNLAEKDLLFLTLNERFKVEAE